MKHIKPLKDKNGFRIHFGIYVHEYEQRLLELLGYYDEEDGCPLKCIHCDSEELILCNFYFMDFLLCEHDIKCGNCGKIVGHWAYGSYEH